MSIETLPPSNEAKTRPINLKAYEGFMKTVEMKRPSVTVDGYEVVTNLPPDKAEAFFETADQARHGFSDHPFYRDVAPSGIDELAAGRYFLKDPAKDKPGPDREYTIIDDGEDKRIIYNTTGIKGELFDNRGHSEYLMAALGFSYNQDGLVNAVPSPETVKKRAARLGVDVQLFPGKGLLDASDYLGAFAEGKYPVPTGNARYYAHDIQDDHLTAMVLGGEPLKNALRDAAVRALDKAADNDDTTAYIDLFTTHLRAVVSPTNVAVKREKDSATLYGIGHFLGMKPETVKEIMKTARVNAQRFGMTLKPTDH